MASDRKNKRISENWWYFIGAAGIIILYALFAYPVYTEWKIQTVKRAYREITEMNLNALDEEDEELLQRYQAGKLEFLIVDEEFRPVYATKLWDAERQTQIYIIDRLDNYQEKPAVTVKKNWEQRIIRLKSILVRNGGKYYVYIRKEIHDAGEVICLSAVYFGVMILLFASVIYVRNRRKKTDDTGLAVQMDRQVRLGQAEKEFVANVSHELKTPLAVISGQVEMLQNMGDEIDRDYYFASIREEIDKMSEMVGNLLDITIMEHRMEQMEMTEVNLTDMMNYLILKYDALFHKNKIKLRKEVAPDCIVRANHMYLEQAINNYIMNAFQHTAQGKKMAICLAVEGKNARISVYNEGTEIAPEEMEHIWQSFYMKSKESMAEQKISNAGLGLYLVKKIVEQHQGECGVENKGDGVEFWIRLALERAGK